MIIWPMIMQSRPYPGYELSFGSPLARVGRLGAENNCYLSHYYILSYFDVMSYYVIISHYYNWIKLLQSKAMAPPV